MNIPLKARNILKLMILAAAIFGCTGLVHANYCTVDMGRARIAIEEMKISSTPSRKKDKCDIVVTVAGTITNISKKMIEALNFATDAKKGEQVSSGLKDLAPGESYKFSITIKYEEIKCESVEMLLMGDNDADIKKHSEICKFPPPAVLPVELIAFSFDPETKALFWETASEINNEGFAIEHSMNAENWIEIGFQIGLGTNSSGISYHYPLLSKDIKGYYRLKQIDYNGAIDYSGIVIISGEYSNDGSWGTLYPNPADDYINTESADIEWIDIFDLTGRFVKREIVRDQRIPVYDLNAGTYLAILHRGFEMKQTIIIVNPWRA
ncbi:MAG: T9SS type A sorting domain-containing protein [Saprospiraceae bacterium]|nr:T9SS type A sorting domain-containing protein [Saprospiraceae bacterium]